MSKYRWQIAQYPHLTVALAVVGGVCMAVAATQHDRHYIIHNM